MIKALLSSAATAVSPSPFVLFAARRHRHDQMPFNREPGFYEDGQVWLYGNAALLRSELATIDDSAGPSSRSPTELRAIEKAPEEIVLDGKTLVCGVHSDAHKRAAIVPLRWGAPRVLVLSGGFKYHFGAELDQVPFRAARLWRGRWDPISDLAISRRAPGKLPTFASHSPTVDKMISLIVGRQWPGLLFEPPRR